MNGESFIIDRLNMQNVGHRSKFKESFFGHLLVCPFCNCYFFSAVFALHFLMFQN